MSTRLDRLILLLETGSTQQIKSTAAKQIGDIARKTFGASSESSTVKIEPKGEEVADEDGLGVGLEQEEEWREVMALVGRILPHLRSKSYDTRSAASLALSEISRSVPIWTPPALTHLPSDAASVFPSPPSPPPPLDLPSLLAPSRPKLLASSGKEFAPPAVPTTKEEIEAGKREVMKRLGIGGGPAGGGMDMGFGELVKDELDASGVKVEGGEAPLNVEPASALPLALEEEFGGGEGVAKGGAKGKEKAPSKLALKRAEKERMEEEKRKELEEGEFAGLSARQVNALKRKRKMGVGGGPSPSFAAAAPAASKPRLDAPPPPPPFDPLSSSSTPSTMMTPLSAPVIIDPKAKAAAREAASAASGGAVDGEGKTQWGKALIVERDEQGRERWPWERVVEVLQVGLFSPSWEIRHGAAMGLRDLLKSQGKAMGMVVGYLSTLNNQFSAHNLILLAQSLLTLLALDRFGDYNSDVVVAPVRETASQTLAAVMKHMSEEGVGEVHRVLVGMVGQSWLTGAEGGGKALGYAWEVRHAGMLGLKFEVAVRADLVEGGGKSGAEDVKMEEGSKADILKDVVDAAVLGLGDADDDVRSVSAACLLPVATYLATRLPEELARVVAVLWDALSEGGDELGSSTGGVMDLLGKLIAFPQCIDLLKAGHLSLVDLVPRLFPFFRHTITNVRLAVPNALHLFLTTPSIQTIDWIDARIFRFLFQNILVEERLDIREASLRAWRAAVDKIRTSLSPEDFARFLDEAIKPFIGEWLSLLMSPPGVALDANLFLKAQVTTMRVGRTGRTGEAQSVSHNVDKNMMAQDLSLTSVDQVMKCRLSAAQAFSSLLVDGASQTFQGEFTQFMLDYLGSTSAHQIILAAVLVEEWSKAVDASSPSSSLSPLPESNPHAHLLVTNLIAILEGRTPSTYYEMLLVLSQAHVECQTLLAAFVSEGKVPAVIIPTIPASLDASGPPADLFTVELAGQVAGPTFDALVQRMPKASAKVALPGLRDRQMKVVSSIGHYLSMKDKHDRQVSAAVASAVIALRVMPAKLNPVIRSIMNGVKFEENLDLQRRFAFSVSSFIAFCSSPTSPVKSNPTDKIIKNLSTFICQDTSKTPVFASSKTVLDGILTLQEQATAASTPAGGAKDARTKEVPVVEPEEVVQARITSRGAQLALAQLAERFKERLFVDVPKLWSCMSAVLTETFAGVSTEADEKLSLSNQLGQETVDAFTTLSTVVAHLHPHLHSQVTNLFPHIIVALQSKFSVIRQAASRAISAVCDVATVEGMKNVVESVLRFLGDPTVAKRQGAVEVVSDIVRSLDVKALPYVLFMIVPILGRMSDPNDDVRLLATSTFASLVKMVPLEAGIPDPPGFSPEMLEKRAGERQFLNQLLDGSKVDQYELPVPIKAELRKYQQDGINWLAFLAKYQLHGILCDDMGLGKSLQSLCILAGKHHERAERFKATGSPDAVHLPSIIVCPPTLTGHWYHEVLKFTENLRPVIYVGPTKERASLQPKLGSFDVVITSYEMVRNDVDFLGDRMSWNYCILDEGHVIKNGKTKLTKAVKRLKANHRLILSGTPIQNNVLELWSLFDFLMPGFLGTERSFNDRFGKPITANRDGKATSREREAAALALEALHKQVLPFLLRRLKEDVLSDLPPKIIQDYYCDLSDVQKQLYDDFSHSGAVEDAGEVVKSEGGGKGQTHVFQSLQYLRKLCNHPCLVAKESEYKSIVAKVKKAGGTPGPNSIRDLENAPKLMALRQILLDCGIGSSDSSLTTPSEADDLTSSLPQHRVLIFCQLKTMLDVIEADLFRSHMPSLSYMRMDGSTDPSKRHGVVQTFNSDPSIDVLLLTTQVGGLGLNLTGADTVIFVEHDWNPMKDLQAMDRAHRLGQKKVVNVYRLITKGTLEEKIMGLQRFKLNIANSIVNQQNAGLESMGTDQVLDLFKISTGEEDAAAAAARRKAQEDLGGPVSQKSLLDGLEDLPAEEEYSVFGVESFMEGM